MVEPRLKIANDSQAWSWGSRTKLYMTKARYRPVLFTQRLNFDHSVRVRRPQVLPGTSRFEITEVLEIQSAVHKEALEDISETEGRRNSNSFPCRRVCVSAWLPHCPPWSRCLDQHRISSIPTLVTLKYMGNHHRFTSFTSFPLLHSRGSPGGRTVTALFIYFPTASAMVTLCLSLSRWTMRG